MHKFSFCPTVNYFASVLYAWSLYVAKVTEADTTVSKQTKKHYRMGGINLSDPRDFVHWWERTPEITCPNLILKKKKKGGREKKERE